MSRILLFLEHRELPLVESGWGDALPGKLHNQVQVGHTFTGRGF